jgi:tyrosyl-tRNA synthetase
MPRYFYLASTYPVAEAEKIEAGLAAGTLHPNEVKRQLAGNIVCAYHGEAAAIEAEAAFDRVFKQHEAPAHIEQVAVCLTPDAAGTVYVAAVLVELGFAASAGEARRLIDGGGVKLDGVPLAAKEYNVDPARLEGTVVQVGKRKYARVLGK